jgi:hypothetical protein
MKRMFQLIVIINLVLTVFGTTAISNSMTKINSNVLTYNEDTEYWGLLIGVNEYYDYPEDSFIENKLVVERLYNTMICSDFWQEDHIKIITGKDATRKNIINGFKWLEENDNEDDVCFIFYGGHGIISLELFPPFDEDDRYDGWLSTYWTSKLTSHHSLLLALLGLYISSISDDKFNNLLSKLDSKGICVAIFACQGGEFDDPPIKTLAITSIYEKLSMKTEQFSYKFCEDLKDSGRVILMPCEEDEGVDGTWFIDFLIQGFQGFSDVNNDYLCTAEEAFNYSAPLTTEYSSKYTAFPTYPSIFDDYPGELVITQSELPPSIPESFTNLSTGEIGKSYNFKIKSVDPDNDLIRYYVEWGDGTYEYSDFYSSNEIINLSHSWEEEGVFNFYIYSEDIHGSRNIFPYKDVIMITDENEIDQIQLNESYYSFYPVCDNIQVGQSFKPQMNYISKVAVPIFSRANDPVYLYIKKNIDDEESLAEACISVPPTINDFSKGVYNWALFDIPDLYVDINETYYIVCKTDFFWQGQQSNLWACNYEDVYSYGYLLYSMDYGENWNNCFNEDFCFVIYGK